MLAGMLAFLLFQDLCHSVMADCHQILKCSVLVVFAVAGVNMATVTCAVKQLACSVSVVLYFQSRVLVEMFPVAVVVVAVVPVTVSAVLGVAV